MLNKSTKFNITNILEYPPMYIENSWFQKYPFCNI